jgi:hypothetical protein
MPHDVIATCPVCTNELSVTRLRCGACGTTIEGEFGVGRFGRLTREQLALLESFLRRRSGSVPGTRPRPQRLRPRPRNTNRTGPPRHDATSLSDLPAAS